MRIQYAMGRSLPHLVFFLLCAITAWGSSPEVDSIDYAHPQKYLNFPDSLGNPVSIKEQAAKLKGKTEQETVGNILNWTDQNLRHNDCFPGFFQTIVQHQIPVTS
jgi:hypothetical protein